MGLDLLPLNRCSRLHLLKAMVWPHSADCVALHQDVAIREELKCFERGTIGPQQPLSPLDKLLLCALPCIRQLQTSYAVSLSGWHIWPHVICFIL